jgi:hypothetical protein
MNMSETLVHILENNYDHLIGPALSLADSYAEFEAELESALLFALENDRDLTDILKDFDSETAMAVA